MTWRDRRPSETDASRQRRAAAIALYEESLSELSRSENPLEWAYVQFKLGVVHVPIDVERVIVHFELALDELADRDEETAAIVRLNLGAAYGQRLLGNASDNIERALCYSVAALRSFEARHDDAHTRDALQNLASNQVRRLAGDRADNLESAIEYAQRGLKLYAADTPPDVTATMHHTLGTAYEERVRGEAADNIEMAIQHLELALRAEDALDSKVRWSSHNNLGNAYARRVVGDASANRDRALEHLHAAVDACPRDERPLDWATTQVALCNTYRMASHRDDHLDHAVRHGALALEVFTPQVAPLEWAVAQLAIAAAQGKRDEPDLGAWHTEQALTVLRRDVYPQRWALAHANLGVTFLNGGRASDAAENLRKALTVFTRAAFPADHARTSRTLGDLYFREGEFAAAKQALTGAIAAGEDCLLVAYTDVGRRNEIGAGTAAYAMSAYCSLKLGRHDEALLELDRGKARLLAEVLAEERWLQEVCPPDQRRAIVAVRRRIAEHEAEARLDPATPARRSDRRIADNLREERDRLRALLASSGIDLAPRGVDLQSLVALIPDTGFLVAPLVTSRGSAAIVIEHGAGSVDERHVVWLDSLTQADVATFLVGSPGTAPDLTWFGAYTDRTREPRAWWAMIEKAGEWLWEHVVAAVHARLQAFGAQSGAPVVVLPQGGLGVLPWHAAWRIERGARRYAVDDYTISYAPGAYALTATTQKLGEEIRRGSRFLGVSDPTDDLVAAAAEGELVSRHFPEASRTRLLSGSATRDAVLALVQDVNYLHFACHGIYDPRDPFASRLQALAGSGSLTLSDVMSRLRLSGASLVCLSACETGITETRVIPDEFLGFPAAFHQAGAPAVSSTLWAVDDRVTMILMDRFYDRFRGTDMSVPAALREAQLWLRDATFEALAEMVGAYRTIPGCPEAQAMAKTLFREFALAPADDPPPFAHPYYWAAFAFSGAGLDHDER